MTEESREQTQKSSGKWGCLLIVVIIIVAHAMSGLALMDFYF